MSKKLKNCKLYVKSFSESKVWCMKDHMNSSMREKPDPTILHVGTNDLNSDRPSNLIAKSIVHFLQEQFAKCKYFQYRNGQWQF